MSSYLHDIERRRAALVERATAQRAALADIVADVRPYALLIRFALRWAARAFAVYLLLRRG